MLVRGRRATLLVALRETAPAHAVPIRVHGAGDPTRRLGDLAITPLWPPSADMLGWSPPAGSMIESRVSNLPTS
ncbi:MAG: hypothetical protein JRS35_15525 [Deltaproteobacteria bacterium]|nr:hypothetical protein [Deltaproteobacteria bacterium]